MAKKSTPAVQVVERLNWRRSGGGTFHRLPGFTRVRSFDTADEAEAFRFAEEVKARGVVNPFAGTLAPPLDQTDLPEHALIDWYMDHGFDPPTPDKKTGKRDWAKWWDKHAKKWTAERALVAWEPLHKVRFYRVTERPKVPLGYVLVRVNWGYNDEWYYPAAEGGTVLNVYRSREKAVEECESQNDIAADLWDDSAQEYGYEPAGANQFELNDRVLPDRSPFDPDTTPVRTGPDVDGDEIFTFTAREVPFWEVIEIELEGVE